MNESLDPVKGSAKVLVVLDHDGQPQVTAATCDVQVIIVDNRETNCHIKRIRKHDAPVLDDSTFLETIHDELAESIQKSEIDVEYINQVSK